MMNSKIPLHKVAVPSTRFTVEPYLDDSGAFPTIRFGYTKEGIKHQDGIEFREVCATRTRAERCCTPWHINGAYDTLVEVEGPPWVGEVRADMEPHWRDRWELHHYMIYLDSVGCYEVIAASWAAL